MVLLRKAPLQRRSENSQKKGYNKSQMISKPRE
jgi:hypothetical protein